MVQVIASGVVPVRQEPDVAHPDLGSDMTGEGTEPTRRGSRGAGKLRGTRHYSKERARTVQESVVSTVQWKQAAKIPTHN